MRARVTLHGKTYLTHKALLCGDYIGAGSVGVANIRVALAQFEGRVEDWSYQELHEEAEDRASQSTLIRDDAGRYIGYQLEHRTPEAPCLHVTGSHGAETIYLLEGEPATEELLGALEEYPLLDDEVHSEVEMEWEDAAWNDWVCQELVAALDDEELKEWAEGGANADDPYSLFRCACHRAMEECNVYFTFEHASAYVDVGRIASAFEKHLRQARNDHDAEAAGQMVLSL